jgi:replication factor A1
MIKMSLAEIMEKIKQNSSLSEQDINDRIKQKMDQLSGLISKEGAAHIIANELNIKLFDKVSGRVEIKNILTGMRDVETVGVVQQIFPVTEFNKDGREGRVRSMLIADATGSIRVVAWNNMVDKVAEVKEGDLVKIKSGYVRENNNSQREIHLNDRSAVSINPSDEKIIEVKQRTPSRKKIDELEENHDNIEILGTIVQVFEPRFFEICPECNRRVRQEAEAFNCPTHGIVNPKYSYVLNLFLDDGSDNIRVVCFKNQANRLLGKNEGEMLAFKETPEKFEEMKTALLGNLTKFVGRVTRNTMFDRLEFIAQTVHATANPDEEIKRLNEEVAKVQGE